MGNTLDKSKTPYGIDFIETLEKSLKVLNDSRIVKLGKIIKCIHRCNRTYIIIYDGRNFPDNTTWAFGRVSFGWYRVAGKSKCASYVDRASYYRTKYLSEFRIVSDSILNTSVFKEHDHTFYDFPLCSDMYFHRYDGIKVKDSYLVWYNIKFQKGHSRNTGPSFICNHSVIWRWRNTDNVCDVSIFLSNEDEYPTKIKDILYCNYLFLFNEYEKMRLYVNMINNDKTYHEKTKNYIHITHSRTNAQRDVITQIKKMKIIDMRWRQPSE